MTNLRDTTDRLALASVAVCHSEPQRRDCHSEPHPRLSFRAATPNRHSELQARNLRRSQYRDPSRPLGMTMRTHSKPKARNLRRSQRRDPSRSLGMTVGSHSKPKARNLRRLQRRDPSRLLGMTSQRHSPGQASPFQAATPALSFRAATPNRHSELQARNLRRSQRRDPSRPLGMTMGSHSKPKARNLRRSQRRDPSRCSG
jgi:hypothetical protein